LPLAQIITAAAMVIYRDRVALEELERLLAWRSGSVEINELRARVSGARVCIDGCWGIASVQGEASGSRLEELARIAEKVARSQSSCPGLSDAKLFTGSARVGAEVISLDRALDAVQSLCSEAREQGVEDCEVTVLHRVVRRRIERDDGAAEDSRSWIEVEVGLRRGRSYGAWSACSICWGESSAERVVEEAFRAALRVLASSERAAPLHPFDAGRATIVLDPVAAAALAHEVSHLLAPPLGNGLLGAKIGSEDLTLIDDPSMMGLPSSRLFDDEGVECRRRTLIEGGAVVDLHSTRETAQSVGTSPGSAHGLFTKPVPFHSTLVLQPGDWRFREIIEETRRGYLVTGVAMATLESGYVRIVPLASYRIERGELARPMRIRSVRIPIKALRTIDAIGRELRARHSYEKSWLVMELAPAIRLQGYVE